MVPKSLTNCSDRWFSSIALRPKRAPLWISPDHQIDEQQFPPRIYVECTDFSICLPPRWPLIFALHFVSFRFRLLWRRRRRGGRGPQMFVARQWQGESVWNIDRPPFLLGIFHGCFLFFLLHLLGVAYVLSRRLAREERRNYIQQVWASQSFNLAFVYLKLVDTVCYAIHPYGHRSIGPHFRYFSNLQTLASTNWFPFLVLLILIFLRKYYIPTCTVCTLSKAFSRNYHLLVTLFFSSSSFYIRTRSMRFCAQISSKIRTFPGPLRPLKLTCLRKFHSSSIPAGLADPPFMRFFNFLN